MADFGIGEAIMLIGAVASAGSAVMGAQHQAGVMRTQARMADFNATTEAIRGRIQANQTRQAMLRTLAAQSARYAGSGLALEGTPDLVGEQTIQEAERQLTIDQTNATLRAEAQRQRARLLEDDAGWAETGGYLRGGLSLLNAGSRMYDRWPGSSSGSGGNGGDPYSLGDL